MKPLEGDTLFFIYAVVHGNQRRKPLMQIAAGGGSLLLSMLGKQSKLENKFSGLVFYCKKTPQKQQTHVVRVPYSYLFNTMEKQHQGFFTNRLKTKGHLLKFGLSLQELSANWIFKALKEKRSVALKCIFAGRWTSCHFCFRSEKGAT